MLLISVLRRHNSRNASSSLLSYASRSRTRCFQTQTSPVAGDKLRILFMGRDEFSCLVLQELYKAEDVWSELMIATQPDVHVGRRGSKLSVSPLKTLGKSLKLPVHFIPKTRKEFKDWELPEPFAHPTDVDNPPPANHLLVTASFGRILTDEMLGQFQPTHRLNVHPSLLPAYRGPAPLQHAILNEEKETGVCVIKMLKKSEGIDAGSIWGRRKIEMPADATYPILRDQLGPLGGKLLVSVLRDFLNGKAVPEEQPSITDAPQAPRITSHDTFIDFSTMTASEIRTRYRALSHQKPLFTYFDDKLLQIRKLYHIDPLSVPPDLLPIQPGWVAYVKKKRLLVVRCAGGTMLGIMNVRLEGKKEWKAHELYNVLKQAKGPQGQLYFGQIPKI